MSHSTQNSSFFGDVLPSQSLGLVLKLLLLLLHPPPSNRQRLRYGGCLEGKRGDYLTSSVLLCIIIVHIICTPTVYNERSYTVDWIRL